MKTRCVIANENKLYDDKSFIDMNYNKKKKQFKKRITRFAQLQEEQYEAIKSSK